MSQFIEMFGNNSQAENKGVLADFCILKAGKSVKSGDIRESFEEELYPCYGGNGKRGYVSSYSHDGTYNLIGRQGALCGNVNIVHGKFYATEHAVVVTPKEQINPLWLYFALSGMNLNQYARGVAQPGLAVNQLEQLPFAIPSMELQEQFVAIAEHADKSEFNDIKSQFIEMFGNQDVNDRCWDESIVKNEFTLTMGKTPARNNPAYWQAGTNKWISISDMARYGRYTGDTQESITDIAVAESGIKIVPKGTIIMSFKLSIGRTAVTSEDIYTNEAIMAFRDVDETKFNMTFLQFLIANKNWLLNAKQAVKGQTLNKESIGNASIIVPPIELQEQFAAIYNQADKSEYGLDILIKAVC